MLSLYAQKIRHLLEMPYFIEIFNGLLAQTIAIGKFIISFHSILLSAHWDNVRVYEHRV